MLMLEPRHKSKQKHKLDLNMLDPKVVYIPTLAIMRKKTSSAHIYNAAIGGSLRLINVIETVAGVKLILKDDLGCPYCDSRLFQLRAPPWKATFRFQQKKHPPRAAFLSLSAYT